MSKINQTKTDHEKNIKLKKPNIFNYLSYVFFVKYWSFTLILGLILCAIAIGLPFYFSNKTTNNQFGYILIDPNKESQQIFQIYSNITIVEPLNISYIYDTSYQLPYACYNFTEKSLFIQFPTYKHSSGEIILHPNITLHSAEIKIIAVGYWMLLDLNYTLLFTNAHFTCIRFKIHERLTNCTIQHLKFYKLIMEEEN